MNDLIFTTGAGETYTRSQCKGAIEIEGQSMDCYKVLDHTGRHETTFIIEPYGAVLVKWTQ